MTGEEEQAYAAVACIGHQLHLCFHAIENERYWVLSYREKSGKSVGRGDASEVLMWYRSSL